MLKVENMPVVEDWPRDALQVRRWDFAASEVKAGSDPDWTAGVRLAWKEGRAWIVDMRRQRLSPRGVEMLVRSTAEADGDKVHVLLEQEPGSSGVAVVDHYRRTVLPGYPVHISKVTGSKVQRAEPFAAAVEAGNVLLVRGPWNDGFLDEARSFPVGAHDDQVDAAADAYVWLARRQYVQQAVIVAPVQVGAGPSGPFGGGELWSTRVSVLG
jgi:predicted phage terminase large subunit-like protein